MRLSIAAFALGIWWCQQLASLPPRGWLAAALGVVAAGGLAARLARGRGAAWVAPAALAAAALAAGFAWAAQRAEWRLADELPMQWEGRDVVVSGVVAELPQPLGRGVRFVLRVEAASAPVPGRIQLSWYAGRKGGEPVPTVRAGERWQLVVRLKRPHGFANPDGFDYEAWLLERNLRATGYVRQDARNTLQAAFVPTPMSFVHRQREAVRARFLERLPEAAHNGVLVALAVGDQRAITQAHWTVFRKTGVAHLVSISGLHVSLAALLGGVAAGWLWRRVPRLMLRLPARKAAAVGGFALAAAYALLAGFGIPSQRALIMLAVVAFALLVGRETTGSRVLALAALGVLAADPWAALAPGFWLSFAAVGVIVYVLAGRSRAPSGWRAAIVTQFAITLATVPALLLLFNAFSVVAPLANALAVPLVSFLVTPLTLAAIVLPFAPLLDVAHWLVAMMMMWLGWLADVPGAVWRQAVPPAALALAGVAGVGWLLLPRGTPARFAGLLALVPMLAWAPPRPPEGAFRATVLDVGHGMAVHVQTAGRDLVYDAGPSYGPESDAGERVLLPYLAAAGVARVDRLVISHDDDDHSGGADSLMAGLPVAELMSGLAAGHRLREGGRAQALGCAVGERWRWDGVDFEVLHPAPEEPPLRRDNDNSCVLRVSAPGGSLLLAGDVEGAGERRLLARHGAGLASSVVVVPHHGSRSSSTPAMVASVAAQAAVFSVGKLNTFGHPHPSVWERWAAAGARGWRTDSQGAVLVTVGEGVTVDAQRLRAPRYWHGR